MRQQRDDSVEIRLAQRLPPDVDALGRKPLDGGSHILRLVIDRQVGAQVPARRDFLIGARRGDDPRAEDLGHLHHARADAARAAVHEQHLPRLQIGVAHQAELGGDADQRKGHDILVADALGNGMQPAVVHGGEFGEGARAPVRALARRPNPVAHLEIFDARAGLDHRAREVAPENEGEGQLRRDRAAANVNVNRVHIDRGDLDQALPAGGFGRREDRRR